MKDQIRALGPYEVMCAGPKVNTCASNAVIDFDNGVEVDLKALEEAVLATVRKHPNLRTNFDPSESPIRFRPANDFSQLFRVADSTTDWKDLMHREVNADLGIGTERPLFKAIAVPKGSRLNLLFFYNHTVGDGNTRSIIINDILTAYAGGRLEPMDPLPSSLDLSFPKGLTEEDEKARRALFQKTEEERGRWKPIIQLSQAASPENDVIFFEGDKLKFQKALERARAEKTTIGGVLMAALQFSMAKSALQRQSDKFNKDTGVEVFVELPVNLRTRVDPPLGMKHPALLIALQDFIGRVNSQTRFWDLARAFRGQLSDYLAANGHRLAQALPELMDQSQTLNQVKESHGRQVDMILSNLGSHPFHTEFPGFRLSKVFTAGAQWVPFFAGAVILVNCVDFLNYSATHHADPENRQQIAQLFADFTRLTEESSGVAQDFCFHDFLKK